MSCTAPSVSWSMEAVGLIKDHDPRVAGQNPGHAQQLKMRKLFIGTVNVTPHPHIKTTTTTNNHLECYPAFTRNTYKHTHTIYTYAHSQIIHTHTHKCIHTPQYIHTHTQTHAQTLHTHAQTPCTQHTHTRATHTSAGY